MLSVEAIRTEDAAVWEQRYCGLSTSILCTALHWCAEGLRELTSTEKSMLVGMGYGRAWTDQWRPGP